MVKVLSKAFFLDRDGIINKSLIKKGKPFAPKKLSQFKIIKDVDKSLVYLKQLGFINIIITNQPDVRKGNFKLNFLKKINKIIKTKLEIDDIFMCLHTKEDKCKCRKPKKGLILKAKNKWNINLKASYLIGDRWSDIELANKMKLKSFYVDYNYKEKKPKKYDFKVKNLFEATKVIKNENQ